MLDIHQAEHLQPCGGAELCEEGSTLPAVVNVLGPELTHTGLNLEVGIPGIAAGDGDADELVCVCVCV